MATVTVERSESSPERSETGGGASSVGGSGRVAEYAGWVYHLGVNTIGNQYCNLRYLVIRGNCLFMYKRNPHENPEVKPIRKGVISHTLMLEELGRRKVNSGELYVLGFYNRLDGTKKGEIACASPGELRKWHEAFEQAKQQDEYDLMSGSGRHRRLNTEDEINLEGHRPRIRRYAQHGLGKLVKIGKGPEMLLRQSSKIGNDKVLNAHVDDETGDALETHDWRCVRTVNGTRIFEDAANSKGSKGILLKSVGVVNASADSVFEVVFNLDRRNRYEWDVVTGDLELVETIDGYCDIVYGKYEAKYKTLWNSKKDFLFSRQWLRGQDGNYIILQMPTAHKKMPNKSGYRREKIPSIWEIKKLASSDHISKCLVTQMVEMQPSFWDRWKGSLSANFEISIPYYLLCQVAGLREYFAANPALTSDSPTAIMQPKFLTHSSVYSDADNEDTNDEFYDAIAIDEDEDSDDDNDDFQDANLDKGGKVKLRNVSWAIAGLALKKTKASTVNIELSGAAPRVVIDWSRLNGSLRQAKSEQDSNCWSSPSGNGFMIRDKTYLTDHSKIAGGDPLLKLMAVDWLKGKDRIDAIALNSKCLVQTEAGKKIPFILVVNLQIPATPNYSLVTYYGSERPINKESLLGRFVEGTDVFRDSRFKLIPSIVEGYWMVKRAVGTKACLLGKAVTCKYLRQDNFLEIDVDIGSSTVARRIISLVLGYITGIVVDLAILIEGREEKELPEYILGTVRLNRIKLDSAITI
ncbi:protein ENHANCED DISEASE RESISTANCE 2-like isoform X2 [Carex littledalei]|uniref:Protein ENHANCED DISEASE RESISTANCE 2-like isoform X2 n=1 Tax=Carex littledalei TaxID=544730 RepID=A0A833R632_9POAL|nr:protein ENHANCED DISEASE RESISTANCE 2-like isoform X2 [Carex littledalei]